MKMKRILYIPAILAMCLLASCKNDDIEIVDTSTCNVTVTVNLTDFFSCYDFTDTKHSIADAKNSNDFGSNYQFNTLNPAERYKSFKDYYKNSLLKIKATVLFYNDKGLLEESKTIDVLAEDIEPPVEKTVELKAGKYTAIATLTFFRNSVAKDWELKDKENLNTVYLQSNYCKDMWSIMSYTYKEFSLGAKKEEKLEMTPKPIGALCYAYFQNFQNSTIDGIAVETEHFANGFWLDPNKPNKFFYSAEDGLLFEKKPSDFPNYPPYKTFPSDFFDYFYVLAPQCDISFEYRINDGWEFVTLPSYSIENVRVYMAYWDYNDLDHPYFGIADNSHWH